MGAIVLYEFLCRKMNNLVVVVVGMVHMFCVEVFNGIVCNDY